MSDDIETPQDVQLKLLEAGLEIARTAFRTGALLGSTCSRRGMTDEEALTFVDIVLTRVYVPMWRKQWIAKMRAN